MIRKDVVLVTLLFILFMLAGCSINHQVIPAQEQNIDLSMLPRLTIDQSVDLVGKKQSTNGLIRVCSAGAHKYYANVDDLTLGAIAAARDILTRNSVTIDPKGEKKLSIAAQDAVCDIGWWSIGYYATIRVTAGQDIVKTFKGEQNIGHVFGTSWAVEQALNNAVIEMFKDPDILNYLKN